LRTTAALDHGTIRTVRIVTTRSGAALILVLSAMACSSSGTSADGQCPAYCSDTCQAATLCTIAVSSTCDSDCQAGIGTDQCQALAPISQFSCSEIQQMVDCEGYCAAFCERAPTCGAFDAKLCLEGCALVKPPICNPASVAPRTCDQLKPEARSYQDAATAKNSGTGFASFAQPGSYGLCESASDCTSGMVCVLATNVCGPCKADADCSPTTGLASACLSGVCTQVECLTSSDCFGGGVCDTTQHMCVPCLTAADCSGFTVAGSPGPMCTAAHQCVQCLSSADCGAGTTCMAGVCQ
jgi:Cys-rich repeat protein